jgi:hypothetical protein
MAANERREVPMLSAIRPTHRPTPIGRVTAALPALPHPHRRRQRHMDAAALVRPGLGVMLVGGTTAAVIYRDKLASMVNRAGNGTEQQQLPDAPEE